MLAPSEGHPDPWAEAVSLLPASAIRLPICRGKGQGGVRSGVQVKGMGGLSGKGITNREGNEERTTANTL